MKRTPIKTKIIRNKLPHNKGKVKDMAGQRYGRLVVIKLVEIDVEARWLCKCDCGTEMVTRGSTLRSGLTQSCGCYRRDFGRLRHTTHGDTAGGKDTPEYNSYRSMRDRCLNPRNHAYADYGGRGIAICQRWLDSFEHFLGDMGRKPGPEYSIERRDNEGDYEPGNCLWATPAEQHRNRRRAKTTRLTDDVVRAIRASDMTSEALAALYGVSINAVRMARRGATWKHVQ